MKFSGMSAILNVLRRSYFRVFSPEVEELSFVVLEVVADWSFELTLCEGLVSDDVWFDVTEV